MMTDSAACAALLLDTVPALMRVLRGSIQQIKIGDDEPITPGQFRLLDMLAHHSRTLSELAAIHHVQPSTMSRTIDRLVRKRQWVARTSDQADRRQVILSLTDEGRAVHAACVQQLHEQVARLIDQLGPPERQHLHDGLLVLQHIASTMGADDCSPSRD